MVLAAVGQQPSVRPAHGPHQPTEVLDIQRPTQAFAARQGIVAQRRRQPPIGEHPVLGR
jgi:hypothetical protein